MAVSLCIHGHFYQPPREDPWLGVIPAEASAAPMRNWNERITRESYAPLAWARRMDDRGRITDLVNCYEWISFNAGPTLLRWMRDAFPRVLERMVDGDAKSRARWGHGNAMAQIYHHVIMPLATAEDRATEVRWAIDDFRHHFGREPEGMWLSECATDVPTLESLAEQGISFVILAPRQARAVVENGMTVPVHEGSFSVGEPYRVSLPSGKSITAVFYHGGLSQAIAFEGLLRNGEHFWQRIAGEAHALNWQGRDSSLLTLATDGETYGHHFTFGEMALAYALAQGASGRDNIHLTNLPAYIAAHPPVREMLIWEPSSWSCVHGVERWRSDCGCTDGGHQGWNQRWRAPLRSALDIARDAVKQHFFTAGQECFKDPGAALAAYGEVLAAPQKADSFAAAWFTGDGAVHDKAWKLLAMEEQSLASFASCAWFFDDIGRIEPENGMTFAVRALDIMRETGGAHMLEPFAAELQKAESNQHEYGTGKGVLEAEVLPRCADPAGLCLMAWLLLNSENRRPRPGAPSRYAWPEVSVEFIVDTEQPDGSQQGAAIIRTSHERLGTRYSWRIAPPSQVHEPGSAFIPMLEAAMTVRPEGATQDQDITRKVGELSQPLSDLLLSSCLENRERVMNPELQATAGHAASLIQPWREAQHDILHPEFWTGFMPYVAVECMISDTLSPKQRMQLEVILSLHLPAGVKALTQNLIQRHMLDALETPGHGRDDQTLAEWVRRVRHIMPDMDWWAVQNRVWELGKEKYPALAEELGFA